MSAPSDKIKDEKSEELPLTDTQGPALFDRVRKSTEGKFNFVALLTSFVTIGVSIGVFANTALHKCEPKPCVLTIDQAFALVELKQSLTPEQMRKLEKCLKTPKQ